MISYDFWHRRFGGAADAVGKAIVLDRVPFTIIGVAPPGFFGPQVGRAFDVAIPIGTEQLMHGKDSTLDNRSTWWLSIMARLKRGQSAKEAENRLRAIQPMIRDSTLPSGWRPEHLKTSADRTRTDSEHESAVAGLVCYVQHEHSRGTRFCQAGPPRIGACRDHQPGVRKKFFGGTNPIGRTFRKAARPGKQPLSWEIVGLV